jgi:hypothetical protein
LSSPGVEAEAAAMAAGGLSVLGQGRHLDAFEARGCRVLAAVLPLAGVKI